MRLAWGTQQVPGQPALWSKAVSQKQTASPWIQALWEIAILLSGAILTVPNTTSRFMQTVSIKDGGSQSFCTLSCSSSGMKEASGPKRQSLVLHWTASLLNCALAPRNLLKSLRSILPTAQGTTYTHCNEWNCHKFLPAGSRAGHYFDLFC